MGRSDCHDQTLINEGQEPTSSPQPRALQEDRICHDQALNEGGFRMTWSSAMSIVTTIVATLLLQGTESVTASTTGSRELSAKDWEEAIGEPGVVSFVKFYSPICGHCKAMSGDWETLAEEVASPNLLIASVDCSTRENMEQICGRFHVASFPTLLGFGDGLVGNNKAYSGPRTLEKMKEFALSLAPGCSPTRLEKCNEDEAEFLAEKSLLSVEMLAAEEAKIEEILEAAQLEMDTFMERLTAQFDEAQSKLDSTFMTHNPTMVLLKKLKQHKQIEAAEKQEL